MDKEDKKDMNEEEIEITMEDVFGGIETKYVGPGTLTEFGVVLIGLRN